MTYIRIPLIFILGVFFISPFFIITTASKHGTAVRAISESKYSRAHSLGDSYDFHPRDGWQPVNITNLQYKYRRDSPFDSGVQDIGDSSDFDKRNDKASSRKPFPKKAKVKSVAVGAIKGVANIWKGLTGIGSPESVIITWYTGHDLLNPSCWSNTNWAPTDSSFACALTLEGWSNRPQCFKFIELCNTPKKCVYVRVVDTCAGCSKGSKHVDLTRAAFGALADFNEGTLIVQLRLATEPSEWFENLWGPKVN